MPKYDFKLFVKFTPCPCTGGKADPGTEAFNAELGKYKAEHGLEMTYQVFSLSANLNQFRAHPEVAELMRTKGHDALPLLMLNDEIVSMEEFPTADEIAVLFE